MRHYCGECYYWEPEDQNNEASPLDLNREVIGCTDKKSIRKGDCCVDPPILQVIPASGPIQAPGKMGFMRLGMNVPCRSNRIACRHFRPLEEEDGQTSPAA